MKIVKDYPPNYKLLKKVFALHKGIVFTYGNTIYNPDNGPIDGPLITHEETHSKQQGNNPEKWWLRYIVDADFRFVQELEAYQNQYKHFCKIKKDRNTRNRFLNLIASVLSSDMYGNICSIQEAMKSIQSGVKFKVKDAIN